MDDDARTVLRLKRTADDLIPAAADRQIRFVFWALCGMAAAIIATAGFVINTRRDMSDLRLGHIELKRENTEQFATLESFKVRFTADDLLHLGLQTQIKSNSDELKKREPMIAEHREMWFMKEHGISNKEDFIQRHGYPAPSNPAANPSTPQQYNNSPPKDRE